MTDEQRLSVKEKVGHALGDAASNFFFQFFGLFLVFYYTDVAGLSAAAVGTMMLVTRMFDAVTDPLIYFSKYGYRSPTLASIKHEKAPALRRGL